jgi:putative addiction module component (TIGR02574 family)
MPWAIAGVCSLAGSLSVALILSAEWTRQFELFCGKVCCASQQPVKSHGGVSYCKIREDHYTVIMIIEKFPEVQRLSASEKLIFVSELWNDLEANPSELPVSPEVISELDRRMEHFRQHPNEFTTWEAVKERVLGSLP